ncbi:MFS transporter [Herbiconiux ginsengi]|nr:MFS transporter [Herbiconiux ginsengi]
MQWVPLSLLAAMGFVLIAAETMPAGLLPVMSSGLRTNEGLIGQFISVWALGTVVVTIPAISLTRGFRRKPLLLTAITGLLLANTITALSPDVTLSLISRFIGGAFCGIIWGMLAAYGRRISPPGRGGLALAVVSTGAPLGIAFGTPLGVTLGTAFDWRWAFGGISLLTVVVGALIATLVPDAPGQPLTTRLPLRRVFMLPGVALVLAVIAVWMLAHSTIYTYIAPYLRATGTGLPTDLVLFTYGVASVAGIGITAVLIDRWPRRLLHTSVLLFVVAALILIVAHQSAPAVLAAVGLWGVSFGGSSAQLQATLTTAGRENSDVANSFLPVAFNLAIFGAGIAGAVLLANFDGLVLPIVMSVLGVAALILTIRGTHNAIHPGSSS